MDRYFKTYKQTLGHDINGLRPMMIPDEAGEWVSLHEAEHLLQQFHSLITEMKYMHNIIDSVTDPENAPRFHSEGMGCGLEDRGITCRYVAMQHGWDEAMDRIYSDVIPNAGDLDFPVFDQLMAYQK